MPRLLALHEQARGAEDAPLAPDLRRAADIEELAIALSCLLLLNLINTPGGPGMDGGIDIPEGPFIGWQLTIGMHVPLIEKE